MVMAKKEHRVKARNCHVKPPDNRHISEFEPNLLY